MKLSGSTAVYGILGDPVEHSLSPVMHNTAFDYLGLDKVYVPFHVLREDLETAVAGIFALAVGGCNVTVPHKTAIIDHLDSITGVARAVGAVNTVINNHGALVGDNTDVYGFVKSLEVEAGMDELPEKVCVFGAGGAARSVVYACAMCEEVDGITIINRTLSKAVNIAEQLAPITGTPIRALQQEDQSCLAAVREAGLVVNTTSLGLFPHVERTPLADAGVLHGGQVVCDIIYNPLETRFLADAARQGAVTVSGLYMLLYQGARAFTLWTGMEPPVDAMRDAVLEILKG